jgi:hypothetical protein
VTATTATVELLTAEVRVLQVGSRQVTRSVFRQLDHVPAAEIEPFGRVCDSGEPGVIEVVGSHHGVLTRSRVSKWRANCGGLLGGTCQQLDRLQAERTAIVNSHAAPPRQYPAPYAYAPWPSPAPPGLEEIQRQLAEHPQHSWDVYNPSQELWERWAALPLIVLAGLR